MSKLSIALVGVVAVTIPLLVAQADEPGRGPTARFELNYLKMIADHHYAALRITELAAGTDATRDPELSPTEGTSPTPNTQPVQAKASSPEIKSMARRNNRMQREEILTAQRFLRDWYGVEYSPRVRWFNAAQIAFLERTPAGDLFDHYYLEILSRHHFMALEPSVRCQVASDIAHEQLHRYCSGIVYSQINDIKDMREMLCNNFSVCDYQPTVGLKGRHTGTDGNVQTDVREEASEL